ncbi:hypothetical protein [Nocardia jiangxiensis]|uniref:Uncharacterized protein n=1 Tax=Nocardia jiangxiensis TaxID=282685 RepID=A0ABW6SF02_9NOCA|nr:hypothetical protein [Nocardia jiangxiensis]
MKRTLSASFVAIAAGALLVGPVIGSAAANPVFPGLSHQNNDWGGFNRPGYHDPKDPFRNDWHCDRHGNWHNNEHDNQGHHDQRCRTW